MSVGDVGGEDGTFRASQSGEASWGRLGIPQAARESSDGPRNQTAIRQEYERLWSEHEQLKSEFTELEESRDECQVSFVWRSERVPAETAFLFSARSLS